MNIKKNLCLFLLTLSLSLSLPGFLLAQIPQQLPYQGVLTDTNDNPLNGTVNLTFRIYSASIGGSPLWSETQPSINVANGLFNVLLGNVTALNLDFSQAYWLSIEVNSDGEMSPRQQLASVPYARRAAVADSTSSSAWEVPGTLQWEVGKFTLAGQDTTITFTTPFKQPPIVVASIGNNSNDAEILTFDTTKTHVRFARLDSFDPPNEVCWLAIDRASFIIDNDPAADVPLETFRGWTTYSDNFSATFNPQRSIEPAIALTLTDSYASQHGGFVLVDYNNNDAPRPGKGFAYRQNGTGISAWGSFMMALLIQSGAGEFGNGIKYEAGSIRSTGSTVHVNFTNTYTDPILLLTPAIRLTNVLQATVWFNNLTSTGVDLTPNFDSNHFIFYMVIERQTGTKIVNGFHHLKIGE